MTALRDPPTAAVRRRAARRAARRLRDRARHAADLPPIVFVHGNGDTAGLWMTTIWRFESNGWPRDRLHAIDLPYPLARDDDTEAAGRPQLDAPSTCAFSRPRSTRCCGDRRAARSCCSATRAAATRSATTSPNGGGAEKVSHAILGGTPNHGVWADPACAGQRIQRRRAVPDAAQYAQGPERRRGDAGPEWMTIRSDNNDKFAQPDGVWIGARGTPTDVSLRGPGAEGRRERRDRRHRPPRDRVLPAGLRADVALPHRQRAGDARRSRPKTRVVLDGKVSGLGLNNRRRATCRTTCRWPARRSRSMRSIRPPASAAARAVHARRSAPTACGARSPPTRRRRYEFVVQRARLSRRPTSTASPFPRSTRSSTCAPNACRCRPGRAAIVMLTRPRGYFGLPRDRIALDGKAAARRAARRAGVSASR